MTTSKARRKAKGRYVYGLKGGRKVYGNNWDGIEPMTLRKAEEHCGYSNGAYEVFRLVRVRRGGK